MEYIVNALIDLILILPGAFVRYIYYKIRGIERTYKSCIYDLREVNAMFSVLIIILALLVYSVVVQNG